MRLPSSPLKSLVTRLEAISENAILLLALGTSITIGVLDVFTDVELLVLYVLPLYFASWFGGRRAGLVVAIYSAISAFVVLSLQTRENTVPLAVSASLRFIVYSVIATAVSGFRMSSRRTQELTSFVVHDLRTPIASTITGLQTLETMDEGMDDLQKEMVGLALVSSQRALTLVNSILDVAKLEAGRMETKVESVEIAPFLDETLAAVALWAQGDGIELRIEGSVDRWAFDRELTGRVLTNLLSNAIKYAPPGTAVTLGARVHAGHLRLWVADEGKGIPAGEVDRIFEPFHMVKGSKAGTGLGLAFCRLAVLAQGGRIWAESPPGRGATMHVSLPSRPVAVTPQG